MEKTFVVVRIRGNKKTRTEVEETLKMLHLRRINNCTIVKADEKSRGMLELSKDFIAYGYATKDIVFELLKTHGRITGNKQLTEDYLQKNSSFKTFEDFASALLEGKAALRDVKYLKPLFRLKPPLKGFKSKKRLFPRGDLGFHKEKIEELLKRML